MRANMHFKVIKVILNANFHNKQTVDNLFIVLISFVLQKQWCCSRHNVQNYDVVYQYCPAVTLRYLLLVEGIHKPLPCHEMHFYWRLYSLHYLYIFWKVLHVHCYFAFVLLKWMLQHLLVGRHVGNKQFLYIHVIFCEIVMIKSYTVRTLILFQGRN